MLAKHHEDRDGHARLGQRREQELLLQVDVPAQRTNGAVQRLPALLDGPGAAGEGGQPVVDLPVLPGQGGRQGLGVPGPAVVMSCFIVRHGLDDKHESLRKTREVRWTWGGESITGLVVEPGDK